MPGSRSKDKVQLSDGAKNELNALGLNGGARQRAENWHKQQVTQQMTSHGAQSATITHLAHARGSNDHKLHITASMFVDKNFQQKAGGKRQHLYVNQRNMNQDYKNAVLAKHGSL